MPTIALPAPADAPAKPGAVSPEPAADHLSDSMAELDQLGSDDPPPGDTPPPKKPEKPDDLSELDDPEPEDKKDPPKPKEPEKPEKPVKAAELRQAYEKSKETLKQRDAELVTLRNELKAAKESPRNDPEKATLSTKLQEAESNLRAVQEKLRLVDFQQSEEFVKTYQKPWEEAWQKAANEVQELMVELEDGQQRPATVQDLVALSQMKAYEARQYAKKMFGDGAEDVLIHLRKLRDLSDAQQKALTDAKANSEAHFKKQSEQSLQERQKTATLWKDENDSWRTRFPKFFAPADGDEEGNALLAKGYDMVDKAFRTKPQNGEAPLTPEERVKLHAEVRNKAAAFPRLALQLKRARGEIAALKKTLAEFEASEPPAGDGGKARSVKKGDDLDDALAEIDSMATR